MRDLGEKLSDVEDATRQSSQNVIAQQIVAPRDGWLRRATVKAAGADASTEAQIVVADGNGFVIHSSAKQTWGTTVAERSVDLPDGIQVRRGEMVLVGCWCAPHQTRRFSLKLTSGDGHIRITQGGTSVSTSLANWQHYRHRLTAWCRILPNRDPLPPNWRIHPSGTVGNYNPTFSATLRHDAREDKRDYSPAFQIRIFNKTRGRMVYNKWHRTTSTDRNRGYFEQQFYTHEEGHDYWSDCRHHDSFNKRSPFSNRVHYSTNPGPEQPTNLSPGGNTQITTLDPTYTGDYSHTAGVASQAVRLELWTWNLKHRIEQSAWQPMSGASFSKLHSAIFSTKLTEGNRYAIRAQTRDGNMAVSDWSGKRRFRTNARPYVPTDLFPGDGIGDDSGELMCKVRDPRGDNIQQVDFRLFDAAGTMLLGYPRSAVGPFESGSTVAIDATNDMTLGNTYSFDAIAYDGHLWSETFSPQVEFVYSAYPKARFLAPRQGLTNSLPVPGADYDVDDGVDNTLTTGWSVTGADTIKSIDVVAVEGAADGKKVWQINKQGGNGEAHLRVRERILVPSGMTDAFFSMWLRSFDPTITARVELECRDSLDALISTVAVSSDKLPGGIDTAIGEVWDRYGGSVTLPAGTVRVYPRVTLTGLSVGILEADRAMLVFDDEPAPLEMSDWMAYFDGNTESRGPVGYEWKSIEGASESYGDPAITVPSVNLRFDYTHSSGTLKVADKTLIDHYEPNDPADPMAGGEWLRRYTGPWIDSNREVIPIPPNVVKNEGAYRVKVHIRDANSLENHTGWRRFNTRYIAPPEPAIFQAGGDTAKATLTLSWARTELNELEFLRYEVAIEGGPEGEVIVAVITDPDITDFEYPYPISGQQYTMKVRQVQAVGNDEIESRWSGQTISVDFFGRYYLKNVENPESFVVFEPLRGEIPSAEDNDPTDEYIPLLSPADAARGVAGKPSHVVGPHRYESGTWTMAMEEFVGVDWPQSAEDSRQAMEHLRTGGRFACFLGHLPARKAFVVVKSASPSVDEVLDQRYDVAWSETTYEEDVMRRRGLNSEQEI